MSEPLQLDQDDYHALLDADEYFGNVKVLSQRKGVTDSDIETALSTLLDKDDKIGACVIVIAPELVPDPSQTPAPRYFVRLGIQVIVQPLLADDATSGVLKTVEDVCERVRQIGHFRSFGRAGTFMFDGMEPIPVDPGKNSYGVFFKRVGGDSVVDRVATPVIGSVAAVGPATGWDLTLTCATSGAAIYYTIDGSEPTALAGTAYTVAFNVPTACTVRAAAVKAAFQQSETARLILS